MRRLFNMPPQVLRLLLLVVGIVVAYSTARMFLTPTSFRQYGWYRGVALEELRAREIKDNAYAGRPACEDCHPDHYSKLLKGTHKTLSCEACHGPGQLHINTQEKKDIEKSGPATCLRCHEANPSRPKWHKQINSRAHYTGSSCKECHVPHSPTDVP
jgi:hypothetical protein